MTNSRTQRFFILAGLIGPVFYFLLMTVLGLLWEGYSPLRDHMSELGGVQCSFKSMTFKPKAENILAKNICR